MEHLEGILKLADNELESIVKNGKFRSREEINSVGELIDMAKDIYCIWEYEEGTDEGYSERRYGERYDDGMSYARGRRNARRDSMGRYSRGGNAYRGTYPREGEYSRNEGKASMIANLHEMMEDAPDEKTRQNIQRMIREMEQS